MKERKILAPSSLVYVSFRCHFGRIFWDEANGSGGFRVYLRDVVLFLQLFAWDNFVSMTIVSAFCRRPTDELEVFTDTHPKVQSAGQTALQQVGSVIKNPEISALVPTLLMGLTEPNEYTKYSLDIILQKTFVNTIDAPSLAFWYQLSIEALEKEVLKLRRKLRI
nr:eIF-2-alpha kinase activator GCN1 isoform X22 [Ipomoea batatas]